MTGTTIQGDHETRITAVEAAAFRASGDLAEIKDTLAQHTEALADIRRLADTRHTAVTTMLQEILDRLPPR